MPYERPGKAYYATATKEVSHGEPCTEDGFVGVAVKQTAVPWTEGFADQTTIAVGEDFVIRTKGIVQVALVAGVTKGDDVHITVADNTLTETSAAGTLKFGRCVEIENQRGTPAGHMRIDLDAKDNFAQA